MTSSMMSNIFWGLVIVDAAAMGVLAYKASRGPSSPEGPVGAWLAVIPPILLIGLVIVALCNKSEGVRIAAIIFLGRPLALVAIGRSISAWDHYWTIRSLAGD